MPVVDTLTGLVVEALEAARRDGLLPPDASPDVVFDRPRRKEHGDWATNVALAAAGGGNARPVAEAIAERIPQSELVSSVDVAGPGFLNFRLAPAWLHDVVRRAAAGAGFGRSERGAGARVMIEYVSANPTGPVNVVSGRHAAVGDAISNLLEARGYRVEREFYANDIGRQMRLFVASVAVRYLEIFGVQSELPEDGYKGDYVIDVAREIAQELGDRFLEVDESERIEGIWGPALARMLDEMRATLERFGTTFDVWFSQRSLHDSGEVEHALEKLRASGHIQEREGALWFLSSRLGDDKDRVLIRSNGEPTYLASDAAYLANKFARGFDHLIYLWGADHHGTVARLLALAQALGLGRERVEVPIVQVVTLESGGETLKGSKRAGVYVRLDELIDEVGADAARYTFLTRSIDAPLDFNIDLAKEQAPENPVYYVQYAHARICSILRKAESEGVPLPDPNDTELGVLEHASEDELMRKLASYEEVLPQAADMRAPQRICRFAEELAATFSAFYRDCRVVSDDATLTGARLSLCLATKSVIADALGLLGVGAPESM